MAEGYARSTGKVGVVLVTSGPGATNAVTGLTDALMDSIPIVCLTGQVPTHLIGNDAFQEADTTGITRPCTKHNYLVKRIEDLPRVMHEAFYVARSGRPGPVVIDLPKDILMGLGQYEDFSMVEHRTYQPTIKAGKSEIEKAVSMIASAKKPLFYCGGGVINSGPKASKQLGRLVKLTGAPITLTLMGLGAYPATDKQFLGMLGMHGTYEANLAMHDADLIVAVGARFDDRITGRLDAFAPNSEKIHIDIDPSSINKNVAVDLPIVGDVGRVLAQMLRVWKDKKLKTNAKVMKAWWADQRLAYRGLSEIRSVRFGHQAAIRDRAPIEYQGNGLLHHHRSGSAWMWAAQFYKFNEPNRWMTSGGLGTMGYGLPSAIGVRWRILSRWSSIFPAASFLMNMQKCRPQFSTERR